MKINVQNMHQERDMTDSLTPDEKVCTDDDDHDWEHISDWYGDPGVINGTCNFCYKRCRVCGKEDQWDGDCSGDFDDNYM